MDKDGVPNPERTPPVEIRDRYGNRQRLSYDAGGRLERVEDDEGRRLVFEYGNCDLLEAVEDHSGRRVSPPTLAKDLPTGREVGRIQGADGFDREGFTRAHSARERGAHAVDGLERPLQHQQRWQAYDAPLEPFSSLPATRSRAFVSFRDRDVMRTSP